MIVASCQSLNSKSDEQLATNIATGIAFMIICIFLFNSACFRHCFIVINKENQVITLLLLVSENKSKSETSMHHIRLINKMASKPYI